ncbi:hypothetical protein Tco_0028945, partial [Tanacetum coccineum]
SFPGYSIMATTLPLKDSLGGVGSLRGVGENFEEVVPNSLSLNCLTDGCGLLGEGMHDFESFGQGLFVKIIIIL